MKQSKKEEDEEVTEEGDKAEGKASKKYDLFTVTWGKKTRLRCCPKVNLFAM